jgi:hypothetical protein
MLVAALWGLKHINKLEKIENCEIVYFEASHYPKMFTGWLKFLKSVIFTTIFTLNILSVVRGVVYFDR